VIPLLGGTVTSASRHVSHYLNLGIDLIMFTLVIGYIWYEACTKRRMRVLQQSSLPQQQQHWIIYGPTHLVALASLLILADPIRHVLQDLHYWKASMYIHGCPVRAFQIPQGTCSISSECGTHDCGGGYFSVHPGEDCFTCWQDSGRCSEGAETFRCLSAIGWLVTVVSTYVGFALFFVAVLWNSNLLPKMAQKWKVLRAMRK
jgi:hypothetical protein